MPVSSLKRWSKYFSAIKAEVAIPQAWEVLVTLTHLPQLPRRSHSKRNIISAAVNFRWLPELWAPRASITMHVWIRTCQGDGGKKRGRQIRAAIPFGLGGYRRFSSVDALNSPTPVIPH
jgi:hypothetical protein